MISGKVGKRDNSTILTIQAPCASWQHFLQRVTVLCLIAQLALQISIFWEIQRLLSEFLRIYDKRQNVSYQLHLIYILICATMENWYWEKNNQHFLNLFFFQLLACSGFCFLWVLCSFSTPEHDQVNKLPKNRVLGRALMTLSVLSAPSQWLSIFSELSKNKFFL